MTKIYYGCDEIPRNWKSYFGLCNAVELDLQQLDHSPKKETLNRWRVQSPKGFGFFLHSDPSVAAGLVEAAEADRKDLPQSVITGWQSTIDRVEALAGKAVVLSTPLSFSPGIAPRALMEAFAQLVESAKQPVIWDAHGMWDPVITREWASELGLVFAYDPFLALREEVGLLHGDGAFIINERAGMRREFDRYDIGGLLDQLGSYNRAFFMLRGRFKWTHATLFRDLLSP